MSPILKRAGIFVRPILSVIGEFAFSLMGLGKVYSTLFFSRDGSLDQVLDAVLMELGVEGLRELWR